MVVSVTTPFSTPDHIEYLSNTDTLHYNKNGENATPTGLTVVNYEVINYIQKDYVLPVIFTSNMCLLQWN